MDLLRARLVGGGEIDALRPLKACPKGAFDAEDDEVIVLSTIEYNDISNFTGQMLTISL